MQFIHPLFLLGLSALAIPIFIHLFNFRRFKKIYFTNVRFLTDIQQETKRHSQLKQLLILAARLLAITCLVIAFSQPYIPSSVHRKQAAGKHAVSIFIDNSFSMEALATEGRLIEVAKSKAIEIARTYNPGDVFQLLTNDFEGRHQRFYSRDEFIRLVGEVKLSPVSRFLSMIIRRQDDLLKKSHINSMDAFIISDFQKTFADLLLIKPDTLCSWYLVPVTPQQRNNLCIDSISFESPSHQPDQTVRLKVHISNYGTVSLEKIPVKLNINGIQKAVASFSVGANSSTEIIMPYTENVAGIQFGTLELSDYPVRYDDQFYFSYTILPKIPILCINGVTENQYLNALFRLDSSFHFVNISYKKLDYTSLRKYSTIILNSLDEIPSGLIQKITEFTRSGGSLIIFPPQKIISDNYRSFMSGLDLPLLTGIDSIGQPVVSIALESELYKDVFEKDASGKVILTQNTDLPSVSKYFRQYQTLNGTHEPLLKLLSGEPVLTFNPTGNGKVYLFSIPLDDKWSSLPRHVLLVPTLFKMVYLSNPNRELYYIIGINEINISFDSLNEGSMLRIRRNSDGDEFIPGFGTMTSAVKLIIGDQVKESGLYSLFSGKQHIEGLAFNYNRKESNLTSLSESEIKSQISRLSSGNVHLLTDKRFSLANQITKINQGYPLWKLFVVLTLVFIACEIVFIRLIKD